MAGSEDASDGQKIKGPTAGLGVEDAHWKVPIGWVEPEVDLSHPSGLKRVARHAQCAHQNAPWQDKVLRIADLKPHRLHVLVGGQGNIEALSWLKAFGLRLSHPGQLEGHTESVLQAIWRRDQGAICSELSGLGQWIKCALRGWAPWRVLLKAPWDQAIGANFTRTLELDWAAHKNRNPPHSPCRKRKRILFFIWVVESDLATAKGLAIKGVGAPIRLNASAPDLGISATFFGEGGSAATSAAAAGAGS